MPGQRNVRAAADFPTLYGVVLGAGERETTRRVEPARDERARVFPLDGDVRLRGSALGAFAASLIPAVP